TGLAAISNASMISFIINSIGIGVTMGGTVLAAQYKGADDKQGQSETIGTLFSTALITAIMVTAVSLLVYKPVFQVLHVPAASMQDTCDYMQIICWGTVFVFAYNAVSSLMKGFGDSKSPLWSIAAATVVNIILDLILVGPAGMGTKGAAYATMIAQGIALFLSVLHLKKNNLIFDFKLKRFAVQRDKLTAILKVGLPAVVQMVIVNLSYLFITGMLNNFGVSVAAAAGVGLKINTFAAMPCWAIGQAVTAMTGQNMGANHINRVKRTVRAGLYLNLSVTLTMVIMVQIFAGQIIMLFEPENPEVIQNGILYLRVCCGINSLIYAAMYTFDSFAIGVGAANIAMVNALLDAAVVRLPLSFLLAFVMGMGFSGVYIGQAVSPILPAIAGLLYFKSKSWEGKKLLRRADKRA
ncbi:MAG: MATE family efflux transporter, partial [Oscillospiraceae bacterium]|nr:MATE family efflux transporter [Oscillospiraceae bacterium]